MSPGHRLGPLVLLDALCGKFDGDPTVDTSRTLRDESGLERDPQGWQPPGQWIRCVGPVAELTAALGADATVY